MITEKEVEQIASKWLDGYDFIVRRSTGGCVKPCGFEVKILDETPGDTHTLFIHESNDMRSLNSKMLQFSEDALNPTE